MAGLPLETWLLALAAALPGLLITLRFYASHKDDGPGGAKETSE